MEQRTHEVQLQRTTEEHSSYKEVIEEAAINVAGDVFCSKIFHPLQEIRKPAERVVKEALPGNNLPHPRGILEV